MLTIKKHHHIHIPSFSNTARPMQLSPVVTDDDELIAAIDGADNDHWTLEQRPDADELMRYWNRVEADIASDPEWVHFEAEYE